MKYFLSASVTGIVNAALIGTLMAAPVTCSLATVRGGYGTQLTGSVFSNNAFVPFAETGLFLADGNGKITAGIDTVSLGGSILNRTYKGTYTVFRNCVINVSLTDQSGGTYHYKGTIVSGGTEGFLIQSDPTFIVTGTAKQLAP